MLALNRQICFAKRKRGLLKKAMELSILTGCKMVLGIIDDIDNKLTVYKSFEDDSEFRKDGITLAEHFCDKDVSNGG